MLLNVAGHLLFQTRRERRRQTVLILVGVLAGVAVDAALVWAGFFKFGGGSTFAFL